MKKAIIVSMILFVIAAGVLAYLFIFGKNLNDKIVIPYIAHQKPRIDPHVPSSVPIADKMDEVLFDGIFNISANASGITYEDGLGEFMGIDKSNTVTIRLKPKRKWHSSYAVSMNKDKISLSEKEAVLFAAKDLKFTLERIKRLGSISPDYILVSQAVPDFSFSGPDENDEIKFQFKGDRTWNDADIKEILSFKIVPGSSDMNAPQFTSGTGPYMSAGEYEDNLYYSKNLDANAWINRVLLKPFIDNSTYATELKNKNINALLSTPFGAISPILSDTAKFFHKSSISTCFFAILYNVNRLDVQQRTALRALLNNQKIMDRFFRIGTQQQRHIANYKGDNDNYDEYLNNSVIPSTSYYLESQVVTPLADKGTVDFSVLPDTVRIKTCLNFDFREELSDLAEIINDPSMFKGKVKVLAVQNDEIKRGDYDAVLVAFTGYRSNFLFDMYNVFMREPDFENYKLNIHTSLDKKGKQAINADSWDGRNFFGIDLNKAYDEKADFAQMLDNIFNFMATREIGDKEVYAQRIDAADQKLALGSWLFSLPSLAYFSTKFDQPTIDLYGTASQLSTIEKWKQKIKK
jgi:hypothetical protein